MTSSLITHNAIISQENWSVTLVKDPKNQHALLVFEGANRSGEYFAKVAHIRNKIGGYYNCDNKLFGRIGMIDVKKYNKSFKNVYGSKTHTWILKRHKLKKLISKIEKQHKLRQPFLILGRKSTLATTAETYNIHDPILKRLAKKNEDLFLKLYDSWKNEGKPTGMDEESFNESIFETLNGADQEEPTIKDADYTFNYMMDLFDEENMMCEEVFQHSCFTWACEQLSSVGINDVETKVGKFFSKIISVTQLSAYHKPQATGGHLVKDMTLEPNQPEGDSERDNQELRVQEQSAQLYRVVTYEKDRDRRTEAFKDYCKKEKRYKKNVSTSNNVGLLGVGGVVVGGTAAIVSAPIVAGIAITGGILLAGSSLISLAKNERKFKSYKNNKEIYKNFSKNENEHIKRKDEIKKQRIERQKQIDKAKYSFNYEISASDFM